MRRSSHLPPLVASSGSDKGGAEGVADGGRIAAAVDPEAEGVVNARAELGMKSTRREGMLKSLSKLQSFPGGGAMTPSMGSAAKPSGTETACISTSVSEGVEPKPSVPIDRIANE